MAAQKSMNVSAEEIAKFQGFAVDVWDPKGSFQPLHEMNPCRMSFIVDQICYERGLDRHAAKPLTGLKILDVGCGGGLASEPLARLGAIVTAIDLAEDMIAAAKAHAAEVELVIDYRCMAVEDLGDHFDAIISLEVVEHLPDVQAFIACLASRLLPGGQLVLSTLNRTPASFAFAIVGAEYLLRLLPVGTHDWQKFIKPRELSELATSANLGLRAINGMVYNPLARSWSLSAKRTEINYIACYSHASDSPTKPPKEWGL